MPHSTFYTLEIENINNTECEQKDLEKAIEALYEIDSELMQLISYSGRSEDFIRSNDTAIKNAILKLSKGNTNQRFVLYIDNESDSVDDLGKEKFVAFDGMGYNYTGVVSYIDPVRYRPDEDNKPTLS